jgi:uncharacterized membrane protein YhaH (DUF805 family)
MQFAKAIGSGFRNYFRFKGTATRSVYWYWMLFVLVVGVVAKLASGEIDLLGIWIALVVFPTITVLIRRLRDAGHGSGWIWLPVPGVFVFLVGNTMVWSALLTVSLAGGFSILAGDEERAALEIAKAEEDIATGTTMVYLSLFYLVAVLIWVNGYLASKKSKSFEEGNKRVAAKTNMGEE